METAAKPWSGVVKAIGPGILYAAAAIGGSHLVQSTRAGADYGFALIWIVILVNVFKYPFFEFAYRYMAATGETMLEGYQRTGRWMLVCFFLVALVSAVLNITGVTVVTASIASQLFGPHLGVFGYTAIVCAVCFGLLVLGHYPLLDLVTKIIVAVLAVSTVAAFLIAAAHGNPHAAGYAAPSIWNAVGIGFLLQLMGWMPTPIDGSVWPTLWAKERRKQTNYTPTLGEYMVDFHLGYVSTGLLALAFVGLGALIMFGSGESFSPKGAVFAGQLITLYTATLGPWSYYVVAVAAFTTMFSTSLTCIDAYPRTLHASLDLLLGRKTTAHREDKLFWGITVACIVATLVIVAFFFSSMIAMIQVATITAFLTAPLMAYLNYRVIVHPDVDKAFRPPKWLLVLSWSGMVYLAGFALLYLWTLVGPGF